MSITKDVCNCVVVKVLLNILGGPVREKIILIEYPF